MDQATNQAQDDRTPEQIRDEQTAEIVARIKDQNPGIRVFQVVIPERPDEIYLARKCSWSEYKTMLGTAKSEAQASETVIQKFLVYPKPDFEAMQTTWEPGVVMTLAAQIQKGLGFSQGATIKNW